jgi:hypothetical protein
MEGGFPFMTRGLSTHQRKVVAMFAKVVGATVAGGTLTTNGLDTGAAQHMKITESSSGVYVLTLNNPGSRFVGANLQSMTSLSNLHYVITTDGTSITVTQRTASTGVVLADADFSAVLWVQHAADHT